ncbi:hypothetical protein ZIOFF_029299 [Zingiber officinale]|uniref:Uncharacterized protein n=1 Tax=Zingiber officinale TaxID=94328 RepID=A0A8J5LEC5_ZINOF|nr:hypothetical protein ZIOFF_029299 [Zingiber officinale]
MSRYHPNRNCLADLDVVLEGSGIVLLQSLQSPQPVGGGFGLRCLWSPEGSILGVAFSKHLVQIYAFNLNEELRQHLEIDAHIGSVNDIAFSYPKKTLSIITCGNDKAIKVSKTMWLISQKIVQEELYVLNRFRCMMNSFSSGCSLLALGSNAVHKLWQWPCDERNPSGKSIASVAPQLRQPPNGILMTNERSDNNPEEATACIALSKNDSYATSTSGGKVSLLNMRTFKEDVVDEYIDSCICGAKACSGGRPWSLACIIRGFKDRSEGNCLADLGVVLEGSGIVLLQSLQSPQPVGGGFGLSVSCEQRIGSFLDIEVANLCRLLNG